MQLKTLPKLGIRENRIHYTASVERIPMNSVVLVLLPVEHELFQERISNDLPYKHSLECMAGRKDCKVLIVHFPQIMGANRVRWSVLQKFKGISLMKDFKKLVTFLIKDKNIQNLAEIRSDLDTSVKLTKQSLCVGTPLENEESDCSNVDSDCPVHGLYNGTRNNEYCEQLNRNANTESIPLRCIPPSPVASEARYLKQGNNQTYASGYTSQENYELGDDDSLCKQIMEVNRNFFRNDTDMVDDEDDFEEKLLEINDF